MFIKITVEQAIDTNAVSMSNFKHSWNPLGWLDIALDIAQKPMHWKAEAVNSEYIIKFFL